MAPSKETKPKKPKCSTCGKKHSGKCNKKKSGQNPKQSKIDTGTYKRSTSIRGASAVPYTTDDKEPVTAYKLFLGAVAGIPDDPYAIKFNHGFNPLTLGKLGDHTLLRKTAEAYKFYKVMRATIRMEPVVSDTAAIGTSWAVGLWRDPTSTGPTSFNLALQNGTGVQTGRRQSVAIKPTLERWFNVIPTEDPKEDTPGTFYVAAVGSTVSLTGTPWKGPVFHLYLDVTYKWSVVCNNDGLQFTSLTANNNKATLKTETVGGKKVITLTPTEGSVFANLPTGRSEVKAGVSFGKIIYRVAGAVGVIAATLPPPWDVIVPAGCWFLRFLTGSSKGNAVNKAVIFLDHQAAYEAEDDVPFEITTPVEYTFNGPLEQVGDFEAPMGITAAASNPFAEHGLEWWPEKASSWYAEWLPWHPPHGEPSTNNQLQLSTITAGFENCAWSLDQGGANGAYQADWEGFLETHNYKLGLRIYDNEFNPVATWGPDTLYRKLKEGYCSGQIKIPPDTQGMPFLITSFGRPLPHKWDQNQTTKIRMYDVDPSGGPSFAPDSWKVLVANRQGDQFQMMIKKRDSTNTTLVCMLHLNGPPLSTEKHLQMLETERERMKILYTEKKILDDIARMKLAINTPLPEEDDETDLLCDWENPIHESSDEESE